MERKNLKDQKRGNHIDTRLRLEMDDYGISASDLGKMIDMGGGGVSNLRQGKNGVTYYYAQRMAFLFGCLVADLSNTKQFPVPTRPEKASPIEFDRWVMHHVRGHVDYMLSNEFRVDVKRRVEKYVSLRDTVLSPSLNRVPLMETRLITAGFFKVETPQMKAETPQMLPETTAKAAPVPNYAGPTSSCDARPAPTTIKAPDASERIKTFRIKTFLQQAEQFREKSGLEWFLDEGRLRARKVTTVEY